MQPDYSKSYPDLWRRHWWWRVRQRLVLQVVEQCLPPTTSDQAKPILLDIGCVGGLAFDELSRFGEVYGVEPDPHLVDSCPNWRERVELARFDRSYRPPRKYDLILMLDVLEHIEDDRDALAHVWELLNPGGHLVLTVPALQSLWSVHDEVNLHYRRYDRAALRQRFAQQGFEIDAIRYFFTWPLGLMYLRRFLLGTKPRPDQDYSVRVPPAPVNGLFFGLSSIEQSLMRLGLRLPVGSSLLAVVRRPAS
jgi:SAM-dependent methyltransferase